MHRNVFEEAVPPEDDSSQRTLQSQSEWNETLSSCDFWDFGKCYKYTKCAKSRVPFVRVGVCFLFIAVVRRKKGAAKCSHGIFAHNTLFRYLSLRQFDQRRFVLFHVCPPEAETRLKGRPGSSEETLMIYHNGKVADS